MCGALTDFESMLTPEMLESMDELAKDALFADERRKIREYYREVYAEIYQKCTQVEERKIVASTTLKFVTRKRLAELSKPR